MKARGYPGAQGILWSLLDPPLELAYTSILPLALARHRSRECIVPLSRNSRVGEVLHCVNSGLGKVLPRVNSGLGKVLGTARCRNSA